MPNYTDIPPISFNFTYWQQHLTEAILWGYIRATGFFFFPIVITGIVTYAYLKNQSATTAAVAILIIFSSFGGGAIFSNLPELVLLFQLIVCFALAGLVTYLYAKRRD